MVRNTNGVITSAPLYIHSFDVLHNPRLMAAETFMNSCSDPSHLMHTGDKLRYYRYSKALLQKEVAAYAGMDVSTYNGYEQKQRDSYPLKTMKKIAEILQVQLTQLLDEYNLFLYHGQAKQIHDLRKSMELTQREFGKLYGVNHRTVDRWEKDKIQMSKTNWVKMF